MKRIESLLNREIGLNARSIGSSAIEAAVRTRMRARGTSESADYLEQLERDPTERSALVEEIVVSETWFFRDEDVFKALHRHATAWLRRERELRVLSLPCATGEECYSVSITLLEAGLRPNRYSVRGVDVSERALVHAQRAVYGKNSFRGGEALPQRRYFEPVGAGFRVADVAREAVTLARGNALDTTLFQARSFDVVLCRNLLIYLDPPARTKALDNLSHWLTDDGLLFAGHAEAVELMDARFRRMAEATPFAYVKQAAPRHEAPLVRPSTGRNVVPVKSRTSALGRSSPRGAGPTASPVRNAAARAPQASLARATELANRGSLVEARELCERVIAEAGASPEAYCLLGIINNAAGQRESAIDCFNKSLYLNQSYYEALVHLALLHEQRGELPIAANFRRRAERARQGESK